MSEWIEWKGGKCPVEDDDLVDIYDWQNEAQFRYRPSKSPDTHKVNA